MNEHLQERFGRSSRGTRNERESQDKAFVLLQPPRLNPKVREYFEPVEVDGGAWLSKSEIPTSAEVLDLDTASTTSSDIVELLPNKPTGAWESKEDYLSTQYELYREDAVRGLREAVSMLRFTPDATEDSFQGKVGIYEKVHICGVTLSTRGIAVQVTFSLKRTGKQILWEQSKRLISGSLVVLTPKGDDFAKKATVAVVAARPLDKLTGNPPELSLFFAREDELEIDPAAEYIMVEDRRSLYEANRHTLLALQHMMHEPFPLAEHIVDAKTSVGPPEYVREKPKTNLTSVLVDNAQETYENVDILKRWPAQPNSELDASQLDALHRILTKRLAIVQGPPGTGKTHVSVQAVKVMLNNWKEGDPPIIIACQTNHAIDQFLRHLAQFEKDFVRLGGMSKDRDVIKKRTLYEVRQEFSENPPAGSLSGMAKRKMNTMIKELEVILSPMKPTKKPLDLAQLENFKILTQAQVNSLESGASRWVQSTKTNPNEARSPFNIWLGSKLVPVSDRQEPEEHGFDFEETDLEFEQLKELEAENATKDDEVFDSLRGKELSLVDNFTCYPPPGMHTTVAEHLNEQNLWKIPEASRTAVYVHLQQELKRHVRDAFRNKAKQYNAEAKKRRIGMWEADENILKRQKVIGMTTTGLSKYRGLISALQPKVILIEEAAETLEAPVTVACMPSVQHLILVGDHQQLRPHTQINDHEDYPWYLNVSMFERLVSNGVEYSMLNKQRRMIPEIRRILYPIYKNLIKDHPSVADPDNRPDVPGMGGVNSWFFCHQWSEQRDDFMSCYNPMEAGMIVGFVEYLVYNGMQTEDITVLTFYNGQRKRILSELRQRCTLQGRQFNVVTVDSYQGEENKVVILSLARSNDNRSIGFLAVENRVCVALSRAQCGFYIFGNGMLLHQTEEIYLKPKKKKVTEGNGMRKSDKRAKAKIWTEVMSIMAGQGKKSSEIPQIEPHRLDDKFVVRCKNHNDVFSVKEPEHWEQINGGCAIKCGGKLPCGHACTLLCHPFSHEDVNCEECRTPRVVQSEFPSALLPQPTPGSGSDSSSWRSFAAAEEQRVTEHVATWQAPPTRVGNLVDLGIGDASESMRAMSMGLDGTVSGSESSVSVKHLGNGRSRFKSTFRVSSSGEDEPLQMAVGDSQQTVSLLD